jgi:transposase-like protein
VAKVKYNRGSALGIQQVWLFGLVKRGKDGRCILMVVPYRKAETLLSIIHQVVEPGTTIIHDKWSSYNKIKDLGYSSLSFNHSYNFVDPETGAHTNKFTRKFKEMNGCDRVSLQSYINEFMWRQWNCTDRIDSYETILEELGKD